MSITFYSFFYDEDILKGHHSTWHNAYHMHEKKFNLVQKNCILF
jgi:hypothetical protein